MIAQKHMTKIAAALMAAAVCLCLAAIIFAGKISESLGGLGIGMEYKSGLFDTEEILCINLVIDEEDWADMLANATAETYYSCDVEINGEMFYNVGVRPKGNTSLTAIAGDPDTDRYSLKLEFDQYVDGQTCYGLDKLILNNGYADATGMKEALVYDMYQYLGVDASLYNYAKISVNGEYWGVYLALEAVEDSFLLRNYGTEKGALYKPDSMNMGDKDSKSFGGIEPQERKEKNTFNPGRQGAPANENGSAEKMPGTENISPPGDGGFGGFSMNGSGANLNYTDQNPDSYSAIWEGEVTDTTDADHKRVIKALKNISEGTNLETYMDVENLLKYMAVHVFSVNEDSLSGMMAHNYYLYESGGQLNILPWDYNLAFGGMGGMGGRNRSDDGDSKDSRDSTTSLVNGAIDNAFSGTEFFDTLMENEEYHAKYYSYLKQLAEEYIYGGGFETFYQRTRSRIDSLVEQDPTAFYTYEEYEEAAETFYEVVRLRGQSISGQIEGTIPAAEEEQRESDTLIDASHLDLSVMGSMSMGDRMRNWNGEEEEDTALPFDSSEALQNLETSPFNKEMPGGAPPPGSSMENMPHMNFDRSSAGKTAADNLTLYGMCAGISVTALVFAKQYRRRKY
ncbi:MAG: hypothetical protein HFI20_11710 [Lachnospiraceae bacterium]|nr:hypothetical protein [Lachnospiraceae bacterium]